jgi:MOSC domain-containing protein YiiM
MDSASRASLRAGHGLEGNADQRGRRQVTLIEGEVWDALRGELGTELDPSWRRSNLMVRGVRLAESRGQILAVGACRIKINGETRPCERMDEALPGLREALRPNWRAGVYGEVLNDGEIAVGDPVQWWREP